MQSFNLTEQKKLKYHLTKVFKYTYRNKYKSLSFVNKKNYHIKINNITLHTRSKMNSFIMGGHTSFLKSFRKSWMGMTSSCQILWTSSIFNTNNSLRDHFTSIWTNNMSTKNLVSFFVSKNLNHTIWTTNSFSSWVS